MPNLGIFGVILAILAQSGPKNGDFQAIFWRKSKNFDKKIKKAKKGVLPR